MDESGDSFSEEEESDQELHTSDFGHPLTVLRNRIRAPVLVHQVYAPFREWRKKCKVCPSQSIIDTDEKRAVQFSANACKCYILVREPPVEENCFAHAAKQGTDSPNESLQSKNKCGDFGLTSKFGDEDQSQTRTNQDKMATGKKSK
ncbi:MAG: hypothetical protein GY861_15130 [bacterium]|nr:hypothetical protein [bacterium]